MINKHFTYNWLLFPILAVLFAGSMVGCGNDPVMEEDTIFGKTTLSITVRGITITKPTDDNYDDYVGTLRVIGYDDAGNAVCNELYEDLSENKSVKEIEYEGERLYQISNLELQGFTGGRCTFYFIANEKNYVVSPSLESGLTDAPSLSDLNGAKVTFNNNNELGTFPILMTAKLVALVKNGIEQEITSPVELVRCVAKLKLIVIGNNKTYSSVDATVTGASPAKYALWENSGYTGYGTSVYSRDLTMTYSDSEEQFSSNGIYFPEKLYGATIDYSGLLVFNISVTSNGISNTYHVEIGEDKNGSIDYNIRRNTIYTVTATLTWKPTFTVQVDSWDEKTMNIPAFK